MNKRFLVGAVAALASVPLAASAVHAAPVAQDLNYADVLTVRIDRNDPGIGYVQARYRCEAAINHLWVSIKQANDGSADPDLTGNESGFGGIADIWLQAHPGGFTCDGRTHVGTFQVDATEEVPPEFGGGTIGHGELVRGQAYVQFCLTTETDSDLFGIDMSFQKIK